MIQLYQNINYESIMNQFFKNNYIIINSITIKKLIRITVNAITIKNVNLFYS